MSVSAHPNRVCADGKFFRLGARRFAVKGVTYGPFAPNAAGEHFPSHSGARRDLALIHDLGANVLRVYHPPPRWFMDLAEEGGVKLLVDIPWHKQFCFLETAESREQARQIIQRAAESCAAHPAVFAISVANEIPPDIVRWSGAREISEFIEELVQIVKTADPACLCTFGNFPSTEYLRPRNLDFLCFNVYLHHNKPFENYLARLQMIADAKPLVLGEFGMDSIREGEDRKSHALPAQIELAHRNGLAGAVIFSFTDEWHKDDRLVTDWAFGLTDAQRRPKPSFLAVQKAFQRAPYFPLPRYPMVSVVVAAYNAASTLRACLDSLRSIHYPAYEVILVDDGSTDDTGRIAREFPYARCITHAGNKGLSVARNTGIEASQGEIIAFTDADCRADEGWLHYLVGDLLNSRFAGIGGHNLLPPEDSWIAAAVMVSPGGPAHVMLTDRLAEHVPGCNMAFYKWALVEIDGFDPLFRRAGDDVDICWRLQQRGYKIGFCPSGFVWHYRRSTVKAYLKQQHGYGEAEALLVHRHPEYFNWFGASQWQGRIYSPAKLGVSARRPMIYHGTFGSGFFQTLYSSPPAVALMLATSLEYYLLFVVPLALFGFIFHHGFFAAAAALAISLAVCGAAAAQADLPKDKNRFWSRPLIALLFFLQPVVRGWARYQGRLNAPRTPLSDRDTFAAMTSPQAAGPGGCIEFWSERQANRVEFLGAVLRALDSRGWPNKADAGWNTFDIEIQGGRWCHMHLLTAEEALPDRRILIRCRLRAVWTLFAKASFVCLAAAEIIALTFAASWLARILIVALTVPPFLWFLRHERNDLRRIVAAFLDEVGKSVGLLKFSRSPSSAASNPAASGQTLPSSAPAAVVPKPSS